MADKCFASLFTGAGGLDLGLEAAGWRGMYASDIDEAATKTLSANSGPGRSHFSSAFIERADVREVSGVDILAKAGARRGSIPLLVGGPPCQSWSSAGHQLGLKDPRGQLFNDFIRIAHELDVRWILFENVRGLLTARGPDGRPGSALELIRASLLQRGFQTHVTLLNAADYGVAQRRVRLIVFGYREGDPIQFPNPTHSKSILTKESNLRPWVPLGSAIGAIDPLLPDEVIRPNKKLAEQLRHIAPGAGVKSPGKTETTRPGGHWGYKQGAFIADLARPARTVTANAQQDWIRDPNLGLRRLCPRECAAIQSFPKEWIFEGKRADQYRLIGNAVPPVLAQALGSALMDLVAQGEAKSVPVGRRLAPLGSRLSAAVLYTMKEEARNGASRRAAPALRARRTQHIAMLDQMND